MVNPSMFPLSYGVVLACLRLLQGTGMLLSLYIGTINIDRTQYDIELRRHNVNTIDAAVGDVRYAAYINAVLYKSAGAYPEI